METCRPSGSGTKSATVLATSRCTDAAEMTATAARARILHSCSPGLFPPEFFDKIPGFVDFIISRTWSDCVVDRIISPRDGKPAGSAVRILGPCSMSFFLVFACLSENMNVCSQPASVCLPVVVSDQRTDRLLLPYANWPVGGRHRWIRCKFATRRLPVPDAGAPRRQ